MPCALFMQSSCSSSSLRAPFSCPYSFARTLIFTFHPLRFFIGGSHIHTRTKRTHRQSRLLIIIHLPLPGGLFYCLTPLPLPCFLPPSLFLFDTHAFMNISFSRITSLSLHHIKLAILPLFLFLLLPNSSPPSPPPATPSSSPPQPSPIPPSIPPPIPSLASRTTSPPAAQPPPVQLSALMPLPPSRPRSWPWPQSRQGLE